MAGASASVRVTFLRLSSEETRNRAGGVNAVGTFGISSVSYYWDRVATAVGRISQYLAGHMS